MRQAKSGSNFTVIFHSRGQPIVKVGVSGASSSDDGPKLDGRSVSILLGGSVTGQSWRFIQRYAAIDFENARRADFAFDGVAIDFEKLSPCSSKG